jgi:heme/copper-type cytochrome/quinol oxidase subunit 4
MLFYGLGGIGVGQECLMLLAVGFMYGIFCLLAIIVGVIIVMVNKNRFVNGNPGKILGIVLVVIAIIFFYNNIVSETAKLSKSPQLCSMQLELQDDSFIFVKGANDRCIYDIIGNQKINKNK